MGVLYELSLWRRARQIKRDAVINGPGDLQTHVWEVEGGEEVGIIEKRKDGKFIRFRVDEKPFGRVVGVLKRRATLAERQRGVQ